jgi:hypothetical protein
MKKRAIKAFTFLLLFFLNLNAMRRKPKKETIQVFPQQATEELMRVFQISNLTEEGALERIPSLLAAGACLDCEEKLAQGTQGFTPICAVASRGWINVLRLFLPKLRKVYGDNKQKYLDLC